MPVKELLKIGEGSYASYLIQIGYYICYNEVLPLLEKFATFDNMIFAFLLKNSVNNALINRNLLVDLVKHYGTRPEAGEHIARLIKSLSVDFSEFTSALRDIRR